jgi:hypothetical protein
VVDEDDDEDEAPAPKKSKKAAPVVDEDDEDEDEAPAPKKSAKKAAPVVEDDDDEDEDEDEAPAPKKSAKPAKKAAVVEDDDDEDEDDEDEAPAPKKAAKPAAKPAKKAAVVEDDDEDEDEDEAPAPKKAAKPAAKGAVKAAPATSGDRKPRLFAKNTTAAASTTLKIDGVKINVTGQAPAEYARVQREFFINTVTEHVTAGGLEVSKKNITDVLASIEKVADYFWDQGHSIKLFGGMFKMRVIDERYFKPMDEGKLGSLMPEHRRLKFDRNFDDIVATPGLKKGGEFKAAKVKK